MKSKYWADQIADKLIKNRPKSKYVIASGITPSGTIHFGNFREIITTDLIGRALVDKVRKSDLFIHGTIMMFLEKFREICQKKYTN